ncbi:MAG: tetratricopeptide repeat protein [Planctomycetales bacterium]
MQRVQTFLPLTRLSAPHASGARRGLCILVWRLGLAASLLFTGCASRRAAHNQSPESAEQLATRAREAADRGDAASAEVLLTAAVNSNPKDCETRLELSEMLVEHGSLAAATDHLRRVVEQNPEDPRGFVKLATTLSLQDDLSGAETMLARALELEPDNPQAWLLRARLEHRQQRDADALSACYRVLAVAPDEAEARLLAAQIHLQQGNSEQALPLLKSLVDRPSGCPRQQRAAAWLLGRCYAHEGRWNEAAAALSSAIHHRSGTSDDWYQVAYARYRADDLQGAREAVAASLKMAPSDAETLALSRVLDLEAPPAPTSLEPPATPSQRELTASVSPESR